MNTARKSVLPLLLLVAALLPACLTPKVTARSVGDPGRVLAAADYAWIPTDDEAVDAVLEAKLMAAVAEELSRRGLREVRMADADLLLQYSLGVSEGDRRQDPYFDVHSYERFEEGTLFLDFLEVDTEDPVWGGFATTELRLIAVQGATGKRELRELDGPRNWQIEALVLEIFSRLD